MGKGEVRYQDRRHGIVYRAAAKLKSCYFGIAAGGIAIQARGNKDQFLKICLSLFALAAWIWILNWFLLHYQRTSYLTWFLKNGTLISAATAVFALTSTKFEDKGLLSLNPLHFAASCLSTAGLFLFALAENVRSQAPNSFPKMEAFWDGVFASLMDLLMMLVAIGWLLVVAPAFYLLTVFTGASARKELWGTANKLFVRREGHLTALSLQPSSMALPSGASDISLGTQAFAVTNALNAIVIFVAGSLLQKIR